MIGSTGADPVFATITDGDGLTSTLGAGTLQFDLDEALTTVESIYNSSLVLGYGASDATIDFSTDNAIIFDIDGAQQIKLVDGVLQPISDGDIDLGVSAGPKFKDAFFTGTVTAASFTGNIGGSAATVTEAAQSAITSLGTLTTLTAVSYTHLTLPTKA